MKDRMTPIFKRALEKRRLPFFFLLLSAVLFVLFFLLPFFKTEVNGTTKTISGFQSFAYFAESQDWIHYGAALLIVALIFSVLLAIPAVVGLFTERKNAKQAGIAAIALYVLKLLAEIAVSVLFSNTATNIRLTTGSYLVPVLTFVLAFVFALLFLNLKDRKGFLFEKKEDGADHPQQQR